MSKEIIVFKNNGKVKKSAPDIGLTYTLKVWKPGMFRYVPPHKEKKYFMYWLFHYCKIFKNRSYSAYLLYNDKELVSSCLVVPSYYKWPFMNRGDVQFTFVMTNPRYKGKGIAGKLIKQAIVDLSASVEGFWYVTDTENVASIRVAEKIGFQCHGSAERRGFLKRLRLKPWQV